MRVLYSPQVGPGAIDYAFKGEAVTATVEGASDTFDFTGTPDGEVLSITTTLAVQPVISARRVAGVLEVVLLRRITDRATEEERFPEWVEV